MLHRNSVPASAQPQLFPSPSYLVILSATPEHLAVPGPVVGAGDVLHSQAKAEDQRIRATSKIIMRQWHNAASETSLGYIYSNIIWVNFYP